MIIFVCSLGTAEGKKKMIKENKQNDAIILNGDFCCV